MRKTARELREEADLAFELDHIANEEDESSEDGDDKVPPRRRGLA